MADAQNHFSPQNVGDRIWHYIVAPVLRAFADDDLTLFRRLRWFVALLVTTGLVALASAPFFSPAKLVNTAGLLFDIAGASRLFLLERIEMEFRPFRDEKRYPHGPPSVAMRELIMPEAGPYSAESPGLSWFYYSYRGIVFFIIGFMLQLIAAWIG